MAEGRSNRAIAKRLVLTERGVEKHVTSIFSKLGLEPAPSTHRRVLAVLTFLRANRFAKDPRPSADDVVRSAGLRAPRPAQAAVSLT